MNDFHYIGVLLNILYGIKQIEEEDLEELGLLAWNMIGNKNVKLYKYCTIIGPDLSVTLPCNAYSGLDVEGGIVEAVTTSYEDWNRVTNYSDYGDNNTSFIENSIEAEKIYNSPYYISGKLLKYHQVKDKLYFDRNYGRINILYKGILADENGLPEITDKEATAIATYIAYVYKYKEGLKTNNQAITAQALQLYNIWTKQCDQARVSYLNQNDFNNILDVSFNWDRHNYGMSTKPLR